MLPFLAAHATGAEAVRVHDVAAMRDVVRVAEAIRRGAPAASRVAPAAVSQQIKVLEEYLQVPLFRRTGRRVELTEVGQRFLTDATLGLSVIRRSAEDISAFASNSHVTLAASTAFASSAAARADSCAR